MSALRGNYGANIGKPVLLHRENDVNYKMRAWAAAGSDARMNGCELPVVINSGSGNQGITASVPVIVKKGVENTIASVGKLARLGMAETDKEIIRLMMEC